MARSRRVNKNFGVILILLAACAWGSVSVFTNKLAAYGFTVIQMVAVRAFFTFIVMFFVLLIYDKNLFRIRLRDLWMFAGTGIASFAFFNICYFTSISEGSPGTASVLLYTSPFWVCIMAAMFFRERLNLVKIVAVMLAFCGCILVTFSGYSLSFTRKGIIAGLLAGFGYALYSIFGKAATRRYHSLTITFYTFLFASIGLAFICDITDLPTHFSSAESWLYAMGIVVVITIVPYLLYTFGLASVSAGKASVISIIEPVVATAIGYFVFDKSVGVTGMIGIAVVIGALVLLSSQSGD